MAGKTDPKLKPQSDMTIVGASIGSAFSIVWVGLTGYFFLELLERFSADAALLSQLVWPGVVLALGVPLIVFVWFGGSSVVLGLTKLRSHLDKLDEYVSGFDEMESKSSEIRQNMDSAASTVTTAANTFSANIERFEQDVRPLLESKLAGPRQQADATKSVLTEDDPALAEIKRRLGGVMKSVDVWFYEALAKRNERPGKGNRRIVVAPGGADKMSIAEQLEQDGFLPAQIAAAVKDVYYLDMSTRPTGRRTITPEQLSTLEKRIESLNAIDTYRS